MGYRDYDNKLLILLLENTASDETKKYIESILLERFSEFRDVSYLYRKIKKGNPRTESVMWTAIAMILSTDKFVVDLNDFDQIIENMPMNDLAIISNYSSNEELKELTRTTCYRKQEEYEKEIGIYNLGKYFKKGKFTLMKRR